MQHLLINIALAVLTISSFLILQFAFYYQSNSFIKTLSPIYICIYFLVSTSPNLLIFAHKICAHYLSFIDNIIY